MSDNSFTILAVESSCDETAAAVICDGHKVLSNIVASQIPLHVRYGGVVPEIAARAHVEQILPTIDQSLIEAFGQAGSVAIDQIDALAVTSGPGLAGSLLVGVNTARALAFTWQKPLFSVNHILGHVYSNFLERSFFTDLPFPFLSLVASGGHTSLILSRSHTDHTIVGQTRDDAAGEAFDKVAQLLGLSYPGGPSVSDSAKNGDPTKYALPRGLSKQDTLDFSFSGLKTATKQLIEQIKRDDNNWANQIPNVAASFQQSVVDSLISKTFQATKKYEVNQLFLAGGVSANEELRSQMQTAANEHKIKFNAPLKAYCTDNAAMIGAAAYAKSLEKRHFSWYDVSVELHPTL